MNTEQTIAQHRIAEFAHRFGDYGERMRHFAYHAALPVVVNAELVHLLRINFFLDPPEPLDYTAEFDLLLSPLCRDIGDGLYEIDPDVREVLLKGLLHTYRETDRIAEIGELLRQYTGRGLPWQGRVALERAQELTALDALDHPKALQWLDNAETASDARIPGERAWFVAMRKEIERRDKISIDVASAPLIFIVGATTDASLTERIRRIIEQESAAYVQLEEGLQPATTRKAFEEWLLKCDATIIVYGQIDSNWLAQVFRNIRRIVWNRAKNPIPVCIVGDSSLEQKPLLEIKFPGLRSPNVIISISEEQKLRNFIRALHEKPEHEDKETIRWQEFSFDVITVDATGQEVERTRGSARQFTENLEDGVMLEMVAIPSGRFVMGSPKEEEDHYKSEEPQHEVTITSFCLGKYPVTQAQWEAVMNPNPNPSNFKGPKRPVERVSWNDAVKFCQRLSELTGREYRLPSEAEWEYACRAGTTTPFHFGETLTPDLANYNATYVYASGPTGTYRHQTTKVGSFPPNAFGLYNMHGNVWEWCADPWHENYKGAPEDGRVWEDGGDPERRLQRGGSWFSVPHICRSACRNWITRADRDGNWGGFVWLRWWCRGLFGNPF